MLRTVFVLLGLAVVVSGCAKNAANQWDNRLNHPTTSGKASPEENHPPPVCAPDDEALARLKALGYPIVPPQGVAEATLDAMGIETTGAMETRALPGAARDFFLSSSAASCSVSGVTFVSAPNFVADGEDVDVAADRFFVPTTGTCASLLIGDSLPQVITVSAATLQPTRTAKHAFGVEGVLARVLVERGQYVREGHVLAELDTDVAVAAIEAQKARLKVIEMRAANEIPLTDALDVLSVADSELQQAEAANYRVPGTKPLAELRRLALSQRRSKYRVQQAESDLREAELEVAQIKAELHAAERALAQRQIRAKFSGEVVGIYFRPGEFVKEAGVVELADHSSLRLDGEIGEQDALNLNLAPHVQVVLKVAGVQDEPLSATMEWLSSEVLAGQRQFSAIVENKVVRTGDGRACWLISAGSSVSAEIMLNPGPLPASQPTQREPQMMPVAFPRSLPGVSSI